MTAVFVRTRQNLILNAGWFTAIALVLHLDR